MAGMYPAHRGADKVDNDGNKFESAYEQHKNTQNNVKEYLIAVEEVKIMQEKLKVCYLRSGPNHFEDCKELRESLWEKMNTPNYGAPGPPRSVRPAATLLPPRFPPDAGRLSCPGCCSSAPRAAECSCVRAQTSKYGINLGN